MTVLHYIDFLLSFYLLHDLLFSNLLMYVILVLCRTVSTAWFTFSSLLFFSSSLFLIFNLSLLFFSLFLFFLSSSLPPYLIYLFPSLPSSLLTSLSPHLSPYPSPHLSPYPPLLPSTVALVFCHQYHLFISFKRGNNGKSRRSSCSRSHRLV